MNLTRCNTIKGVLFALLMVLMCVSSVYGQTPVIEANGSGDSATLGPGENLTLAIALDPGNQANENADWWIAGKSPSDDWTHLAVSDGSLEWKDGLSTIYQGALVELPLVETPAISGLSEGTHVFYFGVDTRMNGSVEMGDSVYDSVVVTVAASGGSYPVVDTGQTACYDEFTESHCPAAGEAFYGQDSQNSGNQPDYTDNGDGTVTDNVTGLTWQQGYAPSKLTHPEALAYVDEMNDWNFAGYNDWRLPTIKQLYSLIDFRGADPPPEGASTAGLLPFIDTDYFDFEYGDLDAGERIIDSQWASGTLYTANDRMMFGVNLADGRIKGYGMDSPDPRQGEKTFYVRLCRGAAEYGTNSFIDNGDGTITDNATDLMWTKSDSGEGMNWEDALAWAELKNAENHLGYSDWRLPDAKELQSIVDYARSPDATGSAAIDPVFDATGITNEDGQPDYPYYWTGTTHLRFDGSGGGAVYVAFGRGLGWMNNAFVDIHGAGCQRSDPKFGDAGDYPSWGRGPQGDVQRVFNHVRLVRDAE